MSNWCARWASTGRLASGAMVRSFRSNSARMNASMGSLTRSIACTSGGAGSATGRKAQCDRDCSISTGFRPATDRRFEDVGSSLGSLAPVRIHCASDWISRVERVSPGGIVSPGSVPLTTRSNRLPAGSPGFTAGPRSPPARTPSRKSSLRSLFSSFASELWQE